MVSYALVVEELGRADSNVRGIVSVSNGLYGKSVARWGSDEQRARLLPGLAAGEELGCYALTEPGAGSDPGGLETRAERDGDGWVLSGQKIFITLGSWATWALVFARTGEAGPRGITCFVVPTDAPTASRRGRSRGSSDCARRTPPSSSSTACASRTERARRGRRRLQGRDVGARPRPHLARRRLRRDRAGLPRRVGRLHEGTPAVRAQRRELPARAGAARRHRGRDRGGTAPRLARGRDRRPRRAVHRRGVVRQVLRAARSRCARRTPRCRRTAATATSTSTRSASTCATRA